MLILLLSAAAGGAYAWYAHKYPCEVEAVGAARIMLVTQTKRFEDVYISAAAAPSRASVIYPLTVMQQITVETRAVDVPACMETAKDELVNYMMDVVRAFDAFVAHEANATIQGFLDDSYTHVRNFLDELEAVEECAPFCLLRDLHKKLTADAGQ
jgi:hypothetical protein